MSEKKWPFFSRWLRVISLFPYINLRQTPKLLRIKPTHLKINTWYTMWGNCLVNTFEHSPLQYDTLWQVGCWQQQKHYPARGWGGMLREADCRAQSELGKPQTQALRTVISVRLLRAEDCQVSWVCVAYLWKDKSSTMMVTIGGP